MFGFTLINTLGCSPGHIVVAGLAHALVTAALVAAAPLAVDPVAAASHAHPRTAARASPGPGPVRAAGKQIAQVLSRFFCFLFIILILFAAFFD